MKPVYVKIFLVDPVTEERFAVADDIQVDILEIETPAEGGGNIEVLSLQRDSREGVFFVDAPEFHASRKHHFRVRFLKPNFSKSIGRLLDYGDVTAASLPIYCPSRLPYWDSGWADYYNFNKFFGWHDIDADSSLEQPISLDIPIREMFVIGHRGAPHKYPENTMASFSEALDLGANGLELDLCLTRDRKIAVFHDTEPVKYPNRIDRTLFEGFPYPLISPLFDITGREVRITEYADGRLTDGPARAVAAEDEFDIINLTLDEVRQAYHYAPVEGQEHVIPDLEEFLAFASAQRHRVRFVFLDVKNPAGMRRKDFARQMGSILATALRRKPNLPEHVVVCNEDPAVLLRLKRAFQPVGEERCLFAYDASGGIREYIGMERRKVLRLPVLFRTLFQALLPYRYNPLEVARRMKNAVVSVGNLMRPAHLDEISSAVRDRDHNSRSPVEFVLHWTLNNRDQYAESLSAGVNGIVTDRPEKLAEYLKSLDVRITCP